MIARSDRRGGSFGGRENPAGGRLLGWMAVAAVVSVSVLGCSGLQEHPEGQTAPPAALGAAASPPKETPLDDLKKWMMDRHLRLYVAGGAALIIAVVVGVGVGKILRGGPAQPGLVSGPRDGPETKDVGDRS